MARNRKEVVAVDDSKEFQIIISNTNTYENYSVISTYATIEEARSHYMDDVTKYKAEGKGSGNHYAIKMVDKTSKEEDNNGEV